jgi:hypothetical protein
LMFLLSVGAGAFNVSQRHRTYYDQQATFILREPGED